MARCFDNEISDAAFAAQRAEQRDADREPRARRPRYPVMPERARQLQVRFAELFQVNAAGVLQQPVELPPTKGSR